MVCDLAVRFERDVLEPSDGCSVSGGIEPLDRAVVSNRRGYSGWNSARVLPSGSLNHADLPMPAVVATWLTVLSAGKS